MFMLCGACFNVKEIIQSHSSANGDECKNASKHSFKAFLHRISGGGMSSISMEEAEEEADNDGAAPEDSGDEDWRRDQRKSEIIANERMENQ